MRVLLFLPAVLAALFIPQQQTFEDMTRETQAWLFDEPSALHKLSADGRAVLFCNHTSNKIIGFRRGCVERKNGEISILSEQDFTEIELEPEEGSRRQCWGSVSAHGFPLFECKKGQFAVVEVRFEGGATWKLKP